MHSPASQSLPITPTSSATPVTKRKKKKKKKKLPIFALKMMGKEDHVIPTTTRKRHEPESRKLRYLFRAQVVKNILQYYAQGA
jgi:hypothetical protein